MLFVGVCPPHAEWMLALVPELVPESVPGRGGAAPVSGGVPPPRDIPYFHRVAYPPPSRPPSSGTKSPPDTTPRENGGRSAWAQLPPTGTNEGVLGYPPEGPVEGSCAQARAYGGKWNRDLYATAHAKTCYLVAAAASFKQPS